MPTAPHPFPDSRHSPGPAGLQGLTILAVEDAVPKGWPPPARIFPSTGPMWCWSTWVFPMAGVRG
jgi:hypothetical protein